MPEQSEFRIEHAYQYDRSSVARWIFAHLWRSKGLVVLTLICFIIAWAVYSQAQIQIGQAVNMALASGSNQLLWLAGSVLALMLADSLSMLVGYYAAERVATRFEANGRQELYESLLGKSKAFHDQQRIGDLMARATDDAKELANLVVPAGTLVIEAAFGFLVPLTFIALLHPDLALVPFAFVLVSIFLIRRHLRRLSPVITEQREQFGRVNATLEETISGIEVVKATAREIFERNKFGHVATRYRDLFVQQGDIEARYLPLLVFGVALGLTFLHALWLYRAGQVTIGEIIGVIGLMNVLRFPTFISIFAFSSFQNGVAGARRILKIINTISQMDENQVGHNQPIIGEIIFENVNFAYHEPTAEGDQRRLHGVLHQINLRIAPGQTVAIVGQTGSGKTALTQLVNRTYDVTSGRVLIDGIDVRDWQLDGLRAQIGRIEQDIFLFSRSIAENIAFGRPAASQAEIEAAAQAAQAHEFISALPQGYATVVGERGMTLSGGQRQRVALARAFLSDPRIMILDDSTSAIDSATEDQIQQAITQMQQGRTTLLITNRVSQIRWADVVVVLERGAIVACGTHTELLRSSVHYRRIFARYETELPPLETLHDDGTVAELTVQGR
jgi:ATP-binding cassette subfamily B protein